MAAEKRGTDKLAKDDDVRMGKRHCEGAPDKLAEALCACCGIGTKNCPFQYSGPLFKLSGVPSDVMKPLKMDYLLDKTMDELSPDQLQRVLLVQYLGKSSDIYLIDEPSAYLKPEECEVVAKVIKRFILQEKKTAVVVETNLQSVTFLADGVIVVNGSATSNAPEDRCTECLQVMPGVFPSRHGRFIFLSSMSPENFAEGLEQMISE